MSLEATLTYVVAVAVPVWLLVEQLVSRRRTHGEEAVQQPEPCEHREAAEPEATTVTSRRNSASGGMRRRAA